MENRKNRQAVVLKHNTLINARYTLSLQEQRVILWLASQVQPGDTDFKEYRLPIGEFARIV
jgi:hypothetical protein